MGGMVGGVVGRVVDGLHVTRLGPRDRPPTVVLHGGGPGCHAAADFAAVLALRPDRPWLLVDLPRYGGAPLPAPAGTGPELPPGRFSGPAAALGALLDRLGLHGVDVLAQSLGGAVALALAARRPPHVGRIVLVGSTPAAFPGTAADPGLGPRLRDALYADPGPTTMRALMEGAEWHTGRPSAELVAARLRAATTDVALAVATDPAARGADEDLGDVLGEVTAPVLAVWGAHDPFAGPDYGAALAAALPHGDLTVLARTAHHPQSERPEAVAALVDAFLPVPHRSAA
ncbi:alpha/beta fold hydrolase [Pseudonocardia sp. WMMC193]|uniref:alpha/beta fold hydrolase n=1 Tax=Pseudonocardia sp. WMMC193 TaxID=2911965 RepID=UPI001F366F92|nr:alpha/beta hydrolase [Pseudonocardia sp. WMMC193]MCF7548022.1 alpha/beta hydrolase [Pseudonocardia sp. WMMC193]